MDIEAILAAVVRDALREHGFRLPVTVATVAANGSVMFTRFTPPPPGSPPGSAEREHVTGDVDAEGFLAPIHMLVMDATGKARMAIKRPTGDPVVLSAPTD